MVDLAVAVVVAKERFALLELEVTGNALLDYVRQ